MQKKDKTASRRLFSSVPNFVGSLGMTSDRTGVKSSKPTKPQPGGPQRSIGDLCLLRAHLRILSGVGMGPGVSASFSPENGPTKLCWGKLTGPPQCVGFRVLPYSLGKHQNVIRDRCLFRSWVSQRFVWGRLLRRSTLAVV